MTSPTNTFNIPDAAGILHRQHYTKEQILSAVCTALNVSEEQMKGTDSCRELSEARSIYFALVVERVPGVKISGIAADLNRERTTLYHHLNTFEDLKKTSRTYRNKIDLILQELGEISH